MGIRRPGRLRRGHLDQQTTIRTAVFRRRVRFLTVDHHGLGMMAT
jgi:hypothetical protein